MLPSLLNPKSCRICRWFARRTQQKAGVAGLSERVIAIDLALLEASCRRHGVVVLWWTWLRR
ncbi:MAG TPA: hypothetical protein PK812_00875 [Beijerinckiaceae bacterium]|nr:hypothetical protein [Beijerinckiaceae bacterium]